MATYPPPAEWPDWDAARPARGVMVDYMDDAWIKEWIAFGFREMRAHLQRHAKYERWCAKNGRAA